MYDIIRSQRAEWIQSCVSIGDSIVEIGCADNPTWRGTPYNVTTCDVDPSVNPNCVAPAEKLPFDNKSFDVACLGELLEHVDNPLVVLKEASRIARKKIVITVPLEYEWLPQNKPFTNKAHLRYFDLNSLSELLFKFGHKFTLHKIYNYGWVWIGSEISLDCESDKPHHYDRVLLCTADRIGSGGGGTVAHHEMLALSNRYDVFPIDYDVLSWYAGVPLEHPYVIDYIASEWAESIAKKYNIKYAHFYGGLFSKTISALKKLKVKVTYTIDVHNRTESIREFGNLGMIYPYTHISYDHLWQSIINGFKKVDWVVCSSHKGKETVKSYRCKNVSVVPHGVEIPDYQPINGKFKVAYLGQYGPDKGIIYLIMAWNMLNYKDATLILAGHGGISILDIIRRNNCGSINIAGFVDKVSDVYNSCHVYIQPSVTEGFGIEVLEAMAHGRPVIVSDGAGASDVVDDGINGFIVPARRSDLIAEKINYLKTNPIKLREMGLAARQKASQYIWKRIEEQYIKIWEQAFGE